MNDRLIEGMTAEQYTSEKIKAYIREQYAHRHAKPEQTPLTHPWLFDPLNPPRGYRYDPYYEVWIND